VNAQLPIGAIARATNDACRQEMRAVIQEYRDGGDAAWDAPTACPGWQAKDAVAHLIFGGQYFDAATRAVVSGAAAGGADPNQREAIMAELAARPREELLGELERLTTSYADYVDGLEADALARPVTLPFATLPVWQLPSIRLNELAIHHWDIAAGTNPIARICPGALPGLVPVVLNAAPMLAHGDKQDGAWQLDIDAPMGGPQTLRVHGGQVSLQPGVADDAKVRLRLDGDALIRLAWGRLDLARAIDNGQVQVEGDREQALALQRMFPGV